MREPNRRGAGGQSQRTGGAASDGGGALMMTGSDGEPALGAGDGPPTMTGSGTGIGASALAVWTTGNTLAGSAAGGTGTPGGGVLLLPQWRMRRDLPVSTTVIIS